MCHRASSTSGSPSFGRTICTEPSPSPVPEDHRTRPSTTRGSGVTASGLPICQLLPQLPSWPHTTHVRLNLSSNWRQTAVRAPPLRPTTSPSQLAASPYRPRRPGLEPVWGGNTFLDLLNRQCGVKKFNACTSMRPLKPQTTRISHSFTSSQTNN